MTYIQGFFTKYGVRGGILMYTPGHWTGEQIESAWRCQVQTYDGRIEIPSMNYSSEQDENGVKKMHNADGIGEEHQALWCEVQKHSFSAKDEDKVLLNARGESRLACGLCAADLFGRITEEKPALTSE